MQRLIALCIIAIGLVAIVYAGVTDSRDVYFSSVSYAAFDTAETCTSNTYEIGKAKKNPESLRFINSVTTSIDSVDTVYVIANMDISTDGLTWYDYCDIDTMEQDTAVAGTTVYYSDAITIPPVRYYRIRMTQAINCSTFVVYPIQTWQYATNE